MRKIGAATSETYTRRVAQDAMKEMSETKEFLEGRQIGEKYFSEVEDTERFVISNS